MPGGGGRRSIGEGRTEPAGGFAGAGLTLTAMAGGSNLRLSAAGLFVPGALAKMTPALAWEIILPQRHPRRP